MKTTFRVGRVKVNRAFIREALDGEHGVDASLDENAEKVLEKARAIAPVDTHAYVDSLHIEEHRTDRTTRRVIADVPHGQLVEFYNGTLTKALGASAGKRGKKRKKLVQG
ncbi:MAG: HK97 gp10 family phage protein [Actinobacteria bacterium]|nr:HK97 gp10 family phage protein [Actinomycetota bacterium]